jgi:hypothetical protein
MVGRGGGNESERKVRMGGGVGGRSVFKRFSESLFFETAAYE